MSKNEKRILLKNLAEKFLRQQEANESQEVSSVEEQVVLSKPKNLQAIAQKGQFKIAGEKIITPNARGKSVVM